MVKLELSFDLSKPSDRAAYRAVCVALLKPEAAEASAASSSSEAPASPGKCPDCGKPMKVRKGKSGEQFLGCTGFPSCKHTEQLTGN